MNISDVNNDGIAMDGMDPVASFYGRPLQGNKAFRSQIGDLTYYFASRDNLERFEKNPGTYLPMAGGYPTDTNVAPPDMEVVDGKTVGNKNFTYRRNLEDAIDSTENNVPIDIREDGSVEDQNLSDSEA